MEKKPQVLLAGGTGLIGTHVVKHLHAKGYRVGILTRKEVSIGADNLRYYHWDPMNGVIPEEAILESSYIINLTGRNIADKRWTRKFKEEIMRSRTDSTALIVSKLNSLNHKVKVLINVSAVGYYGHDRGEQPFTEQSPPGDDFMAKVCTNWEAEAHKLASRGTRLVIPRQGIVLSTWSGMMKETMKPIRYWVGAPLGTGQQFVSWIHVDDLCRFYLWAIETPQVHGTFNAVSAHPVRNKTLNEAVAYAMHRKIWLPPVPAFVLRLMVGEVTEAIVGSSEVSGHKLRNAGFQCLHKELVPTVEDLVKRRW